MLKEIVEGWKNFIVRDPLVEAEAKKRASICAKCTEAKNDLGVPRCGICNCPLAMLTRSMGATCKHPERNKW